MSITIQDGGIENLVYRAFGSKMSSALQAKFKGRFPLLFSFELDSCQEGTPTQNPVIAT